MKKSAGWEKSPMKNFPGVLIAPGKRFKCGDGIWAPPCEPNSLLGKGVSIEPYLVEDWPPAAEIPL